MTARSAVIWLSFASAGAGLWWLLQLPPKDRMVAHPENVTDCAAESHPELRTLCLVQVAGVAGAAGRASEVDAACDGVDGFWNDECNFRGGEELAQAGNARDGLTHCSKAGRFARFCLTHVVWGPHRLDVTGEELTALALLFTGLPPLPHDTPPLDLLRARWWFDAFYGTGSADPAKISGLEEMELPFARGAWALEAVRLLDGNLDAAREAWNGKQAVEGAPLGQNARLGRYELPFEIAEAEALARIPTFGGGKRIMGESEPEDVDIALLEAAYFRESTLAAAFAPFLADPRPRVRYTALAYFRTLPSQNAESVISAMADDHDPIVRALVSDALKFRTWEGKHHAPGLRTPRNPG